MGCVLKQSTQITVRIGPFVDAGDAVTPETGVTLGGADEAELMKAGGGASVDISGRTWAAVTGADGWYDLTLTTADTNTVGDLTVAIQDDSLCLPVFVRFQVVEESVYDNLYAAAAVGPLTAAQTQSECEDALKTYRLDEMIVNVPATKPTYQSFLSDLVNKGSGQTYDPTTDSLEAQRDIFDTRVPDTVSLANILTQVATALSNIRLDELVSAAASGNPTANAWLDILFNPRGGTNPYDRDYASLTALAEAMGVLLPQYADFNSLKTIAGSPSGTQIRTTANEADDFYNGHVLVVHDGSNGSGAGLVLDYANTNGEFTLASPGLPFTPNADARCYVRSLSLADLSALNDLAITDVQTALTNQGYTTVRAPKLDNLDTTVGSRAVAGDQMNLVDGAITTAKFGTNAITASVLATDAVGAAQLAADGVVEIRDAITTALATAHGSGSWATANLTTLEAAAEKIRKVTTNKVVVNGTDTQVDVYEDNGVDIAFSFSVSSDRRTRTPI